MYRKFVLLMFAFATLAGAQTAANLGYSGNGMPATPVLPASSPLIATPVISSSPAGVGASNGTADNMAGATNATTGNVAGASNATGNNVAGASNSTLTMVPGTGTPASLPIYAGMPPSAAFGSQWRDGMPQELSPEDPVYLEFGALRFDSVYNRFDANPPTLVEASRQAKLHVPRQVRTYTNADIERLQQESGVRLPARGEGRQDASSR